MRRVVVDTNVVVAGLLKPTGVSARVLDLLADGRIVPLIDERIVDEYREVLGRPELGLESTSVDRFLSSLDGVAERVTAFPLDLDLPDPDDEPFAEVAITASCDALVTGNRRHFPAGAMRGLRVVSPGELLSALAASGSEDG